ncbi:uncharacterized protein PAC_07881 [Phialocephala subalpina]|uniref:Flavoprotein involved in K+ transport n=1 Tax=Phialocephala subalpina TaxID=576137 RepID=A0A1L7WZ01_9HELO|nr:uncharacterized protein PAC_07881 [Phialocephala subalpina]
MMEVMQRPRVPVASLPAGIPNVPTFDGEGTLDAGKEATVFLKDFAEAIQNKDWSTFGNVFDENSWWRDSLTLTFDKRTLKGKQDIVKAWKTLSETRKPSRFSSQKDDDMIMEAQFVRMAPQLASLNVPFSFTTDAPKTKCIGQFKLVPKDGQWKVWVMTTAVMSLEEHPFESLPRQSPSMIDASQRGKPQAQGLPRVEGVLDAIVIGASSSGISNTIMLDSIGANVAAFDIEPAAGGNWSTKRYENICLHHPAFMIQLPMFPVPREGYPDYLSGRDLTKYFGAAIEKLKLPIFAGIKVVSNVFDEKTNLWNVTVQDVETNKEATLQAKNIVLSNGFLVSHENPKYPDLKDRHFFKGPVEHTTVYRTPGPYKGKDVVIVGSGNSAHDVAHNLALSNAKSVTILQRSPTVLLDFDVIGPMVTMMYDGATPIDTADFLRASLPAAIERDMARGALRLVGWCLRRDAKSAGMVENVSLFGMDSEGEVPGYVTASGHPHLYFSGIVEAGGVVLATGYEIVDLPKRWKETGFLDAKSAGMVENVSLFGMDSEGEVPGYVTASGHPHLYFSGIGFYMCRWIGRYTAIQVIADVAGKFPATYPRSK